MNFENKYQSRRKSALQICGSRATRECLLSSDCLHPCAPDLPFRSSLSEFVGRNVSDETLQINEQSSDAFDDGFLPPPFLVLWRFAPPFVLSVRPTEHNNYCVLWSVRSRSVVKERMLTYGDGGAGEATTTAAPRVCDLRARWDNVVTPHTAPHTALPD